MKNLKKMIWGMISMKAMKPRKLIGLSLKEMKNACMDRPILITLLPRRRDPRVLPD